MWNISTAHSSMLCIINNSLPQLAVHAELKPDYMWLSHSPYAPWILKGTKTHIASNFYSKVLII